MLFYKAVFKDEVLGSFWGMLGVTCAVLAVAYFTSKKAVNVNKARTAA